MKQFFAAILVGLSVIFYLFYKDFDSQSLVGVQFNVQFMIGILLAVVFFIFQNLGMTWRYRLLTESSLSWAQAFRVSTLGEFTSAVTPSSIGGGSLIFLYLHKEGLTVGRSTTIMITSLFLDELFLCISSILVVCLFSFEALFGESTLVTSSVKFLFFIILLAIALWTTILYITLFHRPQWIIKMLLAIFSLPFLNRWKQNVDAMIEDLIRSSQEISRHGFHFWIAPSFATISSWCCRYAIVNALLFSFSLESNQKLAFARQWVLWMTSMASPTPGGSGLSEYMFKVYYADLLPNVSITLLITLIWRIITYYSYLIAGVCIVPRWIKRRNKNKIQYPSCV